MDNAIELRQSVLQDIASLFNDDEAMTKLGNYVRYLKSETGESSSKTRAEILDDIKDGLREVKAARKGKIKLQTAEEFLNELRS